MENLKSLFTIILLVFFISQTVQSEEKFSLENLPATFEEEQAAKNFYDNNELLDIDKNKKQSTKDGKVYVNLKALDKITAKTSSIRMPVGETVIFGKLKIKTLKCATSSNEYSKDVTAYLQVEDISKEDDKQVFIFNGWTFASSPTLNSIDHPIYDLWLLSCENV